MDLTVLFIVSRGLKISAGFLRLILSTTFGAVWSVLAVIFPPKYRIIANLTTYFVITFVMAAIMCWNKPGLRNIKDNVKCSLKFMFTMILVAVIFGGTLHVIVYYTYAGYALRVIALNDKKLALFALLTFVIVTMLIRQVMTTKKISEIKRHIKVGIGDNVYELEGMIDTGNTLVDIFSGKPVTVMEREYFNDILKDIDNYIELQYHLIPYNTIGSGKKMIEVITADYLCIYDKEEVMTYKDMPIALSTNSISSNGEIHALISGHMFI